MSRSNNISIFSIIVLIFGGTFARPCLAFNDEGFQFWSTASASFDIKKDWKGKFEEEFRLGDDGGNLYYQHSDLGFVYAGLADWIDLGFNFRYVFEKDSTNKWREENRPHFNIILKGKLFNFDVSNRSRFEYRDRENKDDVWRYRNKVTVKLPFELTDLKLQPYLADEVFITLDDDNIDRNRLYFGLPLKLSEKFRTDIFYLWQSSKSGR